MNGQSRHIDFLDHVRAVAILAVFGIHALGATYGVDRLPWVGWHRGLSAPASFLLLAPLTLGWAGVAVFFVVSGFCIHLSFVRKPDWRDFFIRRFFRIYPPYFLALLVFVFVFPGTRLDFRDKQDFLQLGTHLALIHNLGNRTFGGTNSSFWTIAVEAQLYMLYPLLIAMTNRWGWSKALLVTATIELTLRGFAYKYLATAPTAEVFTAVPKILLGCPLFYWFSWSMGAYLAEEYVQGRKLPFSTWSTTGVATAAIGMDMVRPLSNFSFTLFSLLTVTVIAKMLRSEHPPKETGFLSMQMARIGLWSYSIYLLHQPILILLGNLLRQHFPPMLGRNLIIFFLLTATWTVIMPFSGLWYRYFELPAIAFGKRFASPPTSLRS